MFVPNATEVFTLGLDILPPYDTTVDMKRRILLQEEVPFCHPGARQQSSRPTFDIDEVIHFDVREW